MISKMSIDRKVLSPFGLHFISGVHDRVICYTYVVASNVYIYQSVITILSLAN